MYRTSTLRTVAIRASSRSSTLSGNSLHRLQIQSSLKNTQRTFITIIQQGHEAWRLSFGRSPVQLRPGLALNIPFYHSVTDVDLRESSISIPSIQGYTADNVPVACSGSLFYQISDGYKACFAVSDVRENIERIGASSFRSVLGSFTYDQVISDRNGLNQKLNIVIGDSISAWGVVCTRFEVQTFKPANREVERQLELQMEAERNRRKQMLDTQAQVNVAEGHKQRVILESEGHLTAKSNEADAHYKTVIRDAEARQQQSLMEASALAQQVENVARSIASNPDVPTPDDRRAALSTLVQLRRLEQLRAIASANSNSTYFFGDKASLGEDGYNIDYAEKIKAGLSSSGGKARPGDVVSAVVSGGI